MRDSSTRTDVSSFSISRRESALITSRLNWGCGSGSEALPVDKSAFSGDNLELATSLRLVWDLVTIGVLGVKGLATGTWAVGTDFTGRSMFLCSVILRPCPSKCRMVYTGIDEFGWAVTTQIASSHLSANLCLPWSPTWRTNTLSPGWRVAPRTFLSYHSLLASPAFLILPSTNPWAYFMRFLRSVT